MSEPELTMRCAGCQATIALFDPGFSEWWVRHGRCLREMYAEPRSEIDPIVYERLRARSEPGEASS